jgi:D-serine deaminase-like pyridoxal phosphate-dependent protein
MLPSHYELGLHKDDLDTPALWVDLELMEANIGQLARTFAQAGVQWRPHMKGIKIPAIAYRAINEGAIGVTCAKLSEAEVMAAAGIEDVLIANQVVGPRKVTRLAKLRRYADIMVAVDSIENAREISAAAVKEDVHIRILVEVNTGLNRCGVEPGQPVIDLAGEISRLPGLDFRGVMGWEGFVLSIEDPEEKRRRCEDAVSLLVRSAEMCRAEGLDAPIVSCGGSGTYWITSHISGVTEIQAGGAIFTDMSYRKWGVELACSLFVRSTVISRPTPHRAVLDAGFKALGTAKEMPAPKDRPGVHLEKLNSEHGMLRLDDPNAVLPVGEKLDLIVGYGDATVFLHDHLYGVRNGVVEIVWDISARGKLT